MRLAVIESAPRGGLLQYAAQLSSGLAARGHDVELVTSRGHELERPPAGVRVRALLPTASGVGGEAPTGLRLLVRRARIALVVIAASLRTLVTVATGRYRAAILVDDLSVAPAAAGALALTLIPRAPTIAAICHEPRPRSRRGGGLYTRSRPLLWLLGRLYPRLDAVFVHGERTREELLRTWGGSRVVVIPHGNYELVADRPPPPGDQERILFFGEWRRAKGIAELMAAFDLVLARRPEARLTIAGVPTPDSEPERVRAWARAHGDRVTLVDRYVELDEVEGLFAAARVVAAPYLAGSQSGVVHMAMTMGRAVVSSDVGELPETVLDGETGIVVPAGDVDALARAFEALLGDPELADRLGAAGRRRATTELTWERVAERIEAALAEGRPPLVLP